MTVPAMRIDRPECKRATLAERAPAAGMEEVAPARRVVGAEGRARLDGHAGHSAHVELVRHDVRGPRERGVDADVGRDVVPHGRRAALGRGRRVHDERERRPGHPHGLGGVLRLGPRLGHDHGDGLAHVAGLVGGQQAVRAEEDRAAARRRQLQVVAVRRHRIVRDGAETVGEDVGPGEDAEHARHRARGAGVDRDDAGMSVRRAHHRRVRLAGQREVVAESPLAAEQPLVLRAAQLYSAS